ncbi:MAG: lipid-A-disaccharide synthase [Vicinamibacterales bacterium]|nr:lipid-A-disaccharide synthase [Vicinamibacterales bacterium]
MTRIMISCGEPSGDLYAGALTTALRAACPDVDVFGFGGAHLRAAGGRLIGDYHGLAVTGLTEAIGIIPQSLRMLRRLTDAARETRPDALVVIDFPDFNFHLLAKIKRMGVPVVYYVTPQIWAWRQGRMKTIQRYVDRALPIFPFEEVLYQRAGVDVRFVGHPLVDMAVAGTPREAVLAEAGLDPARPTVALLPGSRANELHQLLPVIAEAVPQIRAAVPAVQFLVACAPNLDAAAFAPLAALLPPASFVTGRADDVLAASDVVVTASGTATVQAALHTRPMVVLYKLSPLTYALGKPFVKVQTYAMANLVAGARVVPELIQDACTPERVAAETVSLLTDRDRWSTMQARLAETRARLGPPGASARAAEAVLEVASCNRH